MDKTDLFGTAANVLSVRSRDPYVFLLVIQASRFGGLLVVHVGVGLV